eukprot:3499809-Amphidinium_carterae.1
MSCGEEAEALSHIIHCCACWQQGGRYGYFCLCNFCPLPLAVALLLTRMALAQQQSAPSSLDTMQTKVWRNFTLAMVSDCKGVVAALRALQAGHRRPKGRKSVPMLPLLPSSVSIA